MSAKPAKPISLTQTAAMMNVHRNTVSGWIARGCPVVARADRSRGIEWQLRFSEVADWRIERAVADATAGLQGHDPNTSKEGAARRRAVARAIVAEIDADDLLRSVVSRVDADRMKDDFVDALRVAFAGAGARIAERTAAVATASQINELCRDEINKTMRMAQADFAVRSADPVAVDKLSGRRTAAVPAQPAH